MGIIRLDATQKSTLNWEDAVLKAKQAIKQNARILWELDFGLFDRLLHPLPHLQQFQSFCLAIDHFREIIWSQFAEVSDGVCLYRGPLDKVESIIATHQDKFSEWLSTFVECSQSAEDTFLERLFCRDIALDYIKQLAGQLPYGAIPTIKPILMEQLSPVESSIFFNEEFYRPLEIGVREAEGSTAICLPSTSHYCRESIDLLNTACEELVKRGVQFRFIAEEALIMNLGGLDELIVAPKTLSSQGKRKLQGFCAAGGTVITPCEEHLNLSF